MKGLAIGQKADVTRIFEAKDIAAYRELTGDVGLGFGPGDQTENGQIIPGPLIGGMFSYLLGTRLPGRGTNWLKQQLAFHRQSHLGEELTAEVEIIRLRPEKALVNLRTTCTNNHDELVCVGEALVLVADLEIEKALEKKCN